MSQKGWIANLHFENSNVSFHKKENIRTEVFSFRSPARGLIGFNFGQSENRFLGIQIYYANYCLGPMFTDFSEYFRDEEPLAVIRAESSDELCWFYLGYDQTHQFRSAICQTIDMYGPVAGTAVLDFNSEYKLFGIELIGFNFGMER